MSDDSWKDSYDAWKLASPDDDYADECEHDETEIDVCTGRVECQICGERWWATKEQVDAECQRIADYAKWAAQENRREHWRQLTAWFRWPLYRLLERVWPRKSCAVLYDDEIPF